MGKPVDFAGQRKQAEAEGMLGGGGFYKVKEGDNRIRLMSECLPHKSEFQGKPSFKWLCYVLDRRDGEVKAFFMPHKVYKAIEALQVNEDYAFSEVPMPYDLTIHAKKAGTKEVEYTLMPARKETPLTDDELEKLDAAKPLAELKAAIDEKQKKAPASEHATEPAAPMPSHIDAPLSDEDIPF
jgi:hypothetical protein